MADNITEENQEPSEVWLENPTTKETTFTHNALLEITAGMLLARTTSSTAPYTAGDIVPYDSTDTTTGGNVIVGVASADRSLAASGSISIDFAIEGKIAQDAISKADATAVTVAELDALRANTGILPITVTDQSVYR